MKAAPHVRRLAPRQRGASLLFALLALGAMALAALALVRAVDTGTLVVGNIGFKQDATASADLATRQAIAAIATLAAANPANLNANQPASGYYASSYPTMDVTARQVDASHVQIDWDGDGSCPSVSPTCLRTVAPATQPADGVTTTRYLVTRLCLAAADPTASGNNCAAQALSIATSDKGGLTYANPKDPSSVLSPYYRVIVRVTGARGTTSLTETIVRF